jgi:hypothetical protein
MSTKSKIALVAPLILGTASAALATHAFAANNYDSPMGAHLRWSDCRVRTEGQCL